VKVDDQAFVVTEGEVVVRVRGHALLNRGDDGTIFGNRPVLEDKSNTKRLSRELLELLNDLRIALPGVQVLFAFLLTLPFTSGFGKLSE